MIIFILRSNNAFYHADHTNPGTLLQNQKGNCFRIQITPQHHRHLLPKNWHPHKKKNQS